MSRKALKGYLPPMEHHRASIRRARPLLGTFVEIIASGAAAAEVEAGVEAAFGAIAKVHRLMSFHEAGSDVSRLNRDASAGAITVHPWTFQVLETALDLHRRTGGIFDIAIAPALQKLNLLPDLPGKCGEQGGVEDGKMVLSYPNGIDLLPNGGVRFQSRGMKIDLGGIAKGFAVDCAIDALKKRGIRAALVNAGGDLAAFGSEAYPIHIRDPRDPRRAVCEIELRSGSLATSGPRYDPVLAADIECPAIIDPRTQAPAFSCAGVSVYAPACMIADALTKVVMIVGEAAIPTLDNYGANALMVSGDGRMSFTPGFQRPLDRAA
jgi:FAD:protein FMN transferase